MTQPLELLPCPACDQVPTETHPDLPAIQFIHTDTYCVACTTAACCIFGPRGRTKEQAIAKWNALPRSSPAVAPRLRDAIRLALAEDDPDYYPAPEVDCPTIHITYGLTDKSIDRCADIAYATVVNQQPIAAAQGGQVDREKLREFLKRGISNHQKDEEHQYRYALRDTIDALDRGDFNSAVPSAPGWERARQKGLACIACSYRELRNSGCI